MISITDKKPMKNGGAGRYRTYTASVGTGGAGTETVTVRASTPNHALTLLQRMGYKRISNIAAL